MLRFKSDDGIGPSTTITNAETGEDVMKLLSIGYGVTVTIGNVITADCRLDMPSIDIVAGMSVIHTLNPATGKYEPVAAIEFRDGSRVEISDDGTPSLTTI